MLPRLGGFLYGIRRRWIKEAFIARVDVVSIFALTAHQKVRLAMSIDTSKPFSRLSSSVADATGKPAAFAFSLFFILLWAASGPFFHFSDTWQLVINTGTTIVSFLQGFLLQSSYNRDGAAIQAKLDELIRVSAAGNRYIGIEDLSAEEVEAVRAQDEGTRASRRERAQAVADRASKQHDAAPA